ncbi:MAG TPA: type III-B CRISPR module-associated Cmr3 family protein, partial [Thermoanaerobaculia bacterium]|nr:type III-B CRISPR module-associated Cmr3 family protein [Thermoanaerobaculia bacterium]
MTCWLVEPRDPLIARDGRPANNLRFTTTRFPFPSLLAGAARTRMGSENGAFSVPHGKLDDLKRVSVHGPILAELEPGSGAVLGWFAPAPRDAVLAREEDGEKRILRRRLRPRKLAPGERLDSLKEMELLPVDAPGLGSDKPLSEAPAFWTWEEFRKWLVEPQEQEGVIVPAALGVPDLLREERSHLALQPGERVGMDGMIFSTSGLRFLHARKKADEPTDKDKGKAEENTLDPRRFALSLRSPGGTVDGRPLALREETAPLGGERRLARWSPASQGWPELPPEVLEKVVK